MPSFDVDIQHDVEVPDGLLAQLETAVLTTLRHEHVTPPVSLSLLLTNDKRIQELSHTYRQVDRPTDVLSFPSGESMPGMDQLPRYLGDVVISVPFARRQATAGGHRLAAELQLLAVHGVLHLLGFDHAVPDEKQRMWQIQSAVLKEIGLAQIAPAEEPNA
jgi:probable rRNA maturation factor